MSRYKLRLVPQGIIPRGLDLALKLRKAGTPGEAPGECVPCCRGYELQTGTNCTYDPNTNELTIINGSAPWSAAIVANVETCGSTATEWTATLLEVASGFTINVDSQDTDGEGRPRVFVSGESATSPVAYAARIGLLLDDVTLCLPVVVKQIATLCHFQFNSGDGLTPDPTIVGATIEPPDFTFPADGTGWTGILQISINGDDCVGRTITYSLNDLSGAGSAIFTDNGDGTASVVPTGANPGGYFEVSCLVDGAPHSGLPTITFTPV